MTVGIVPVVIFSWLYEITPEGIKREAGGQVEHTAGTARKLDIAVIVMLAVAIGLFAQDRLSRESAPAPTPSHEAVVKAEPALVTEGPPMVAVLPFTSASLEGESDFFATGVHDDLLTQLAKLESMRVISRTSVLQYKGTVRNLREIGQALGADIILEGGVQAAGERIRINAQLINAHTDEHLWAETYDRALTPSNIFDVQREIALAITNAMNTTLTVQDNEQLTVIPTENMAAYRAYRRAMDIRNEPNSSGINEPAYLEALEEAIALDPNFVRARAELVGVKALQNIGLVEPDPEIARVVEQELEQIRAIAPGSAEYLFAQSYYIYYILRDYDHAHDVVTQAISRNPSDINVLELKTWIERRQGNFEIRTESFRELARLDPRNPLWNVAIINNLWVTHQYSAVTGELRTAPTDNDWVDTIRVLMALREDGEFVRMQESMQEIYAGREEERPINFWAAHWLNRDYAEVVRYLESTGPQPVLEVHQFNNDGWLGLATYWLVRDQVQLQRYIDLAKQSLDSRRGATGELQIIAEYTLLALVHAVQGDQQATLKVYRRWKDLSAADPTHGLLDGVAMCWTLGIAGATTEATKCLRTYFVKPSNAMPFMDPYLPFFDSMRDDPQFLELMSDVEAGVFDPGFY